ncbi:LysR substrate-binding domain-containing protein [Agrobacterium vitis]|uniref:LysR substrate-binding domain-containing protein n=1 Tax=Agrobacterium vitis TaxID=373 RepID=UPI0012E8791C|nr:LysR substrate-binding domain-containing protein [Agrobacterium vitis]MVA52640.1 LysR family transcriptional regulator [Agrobacterium vitis]MVA63936.1 LysR family transcriptional regulator [Agrobacterium vitis]
MKRGRLPLTALRSFEGAGRLLSFTLASEELCISQAAVSRQVRELENILGQQLFERYHRRVSLTPGGEKLLAVLTRAFDEISTSIADLRDEKTWSTVVVSAEPSFASAWLVRNLAGFRQERPDVDIVLDADPRLIEFRNDQAVIAIRHSVTQSEWPRVESRRLADVRIIPVIAPTLIAKPGHFEQPSDLLDFPLLHEESRDLWQRWFTRAGVETTIQRGTVYTDGGLILQAALQGEGAGLVDELFAQDDLSTGRLLQPFQISVQHGTYWLVAKSFAALSDGASAFVQWLESNFRTSREAT